MTMPGSIQTAYQSHQLDRALCLARQEALRTDMRAAGVAALMVRGRGQLSRLFNHWAREFFPAAALIRADGPSVIAVREGYEGTLHADDISFWEATRVSSPRPNLPDLAVEALHDLLPAGSRVGVDGDVPLGFAGIYDVVDMRPQIARRTRAKDADELALIRAAAAAGEVAYAAIEPLLVAGTREIDLFAAYEAAAVRAAGMPIGELGNDYRGGAPGGMPRITPLVEGELIPIDTGVALRGYHSDLCRTYPVGGRWDDFQIDAARRVVEAHALATEMIAPGVSCKAVYTEVHRFLDGYRGLRFPTHLGHGNGLHPVETPRINPRWDDHFEPGDTFTLEPGLYGEALRGGIRIENDYVLTDKGVECLSDSASVVPG
ncbi:MAG: aminopeptidase P family protein [Rhodobiaceae bacterium]|nr:aminopeptidase P family protein [Rhodobiaceae bacterium]